MATISSPKAKLARTVNLAVFEDGSWKIISDLEPAEIKSLLEEKLAEVNSVLDRRTAGEKDEDDEDDDTAGVTVTTLGGQG